MSAGIHVGFTMTQLAPLRSVICTLSSKHETSRGFVSLYNLQSALKSAKFASPARDDTLSRQDRRRRPSLHHFGVKSWHRFPIRLSLASTVGCYMQKYPEVKIVQGYISTSFYLSLVAFSLRFLAASAQWNFGAGIGYHGLYCSAHLRLASY